MIKIAVIVLITAVVTYCITRFQQKRMIKAAADQAYYEGFEDCKKHRPVALEPERDQEEAPWERTGFYQSRPSYAYSPPAYSPPAYSPPAYSPPAYSTPPYGVVPEPVFTSPSLADTTAAQQEVDQFCKDMDRDTELFLAHLDVTGYGTRVFASRDFEMTSPIPAVIARETITTREVILSGMSSSNGSG